LWLAAQDVARARGFKVLAARAGEAESVLAYASVADLLRDVDPAILKQLPQVQRGAVDRVMLRAGRDDPTTDQRVVAATFAAVVDRLAMESPVLIAIDDAQWLDRSSQDVVAFSARRFKRRVALLLTERSDGGGASAVTWLQLSKPDGIERVRVGPLSLGGLHSMTSARLGRSFPRPTMVRIAEISDGNPFYALELARAIDVGSAGAEPVLPGTLAELMRMRIGRLDPDARQLLLAASADASPTVELVAEVTGTTVQRGRGSRRSSRQGHRRDRRRSRPVLPPDVGPKRVHRRDSGPTSSDAPVVSRRRDAARAEGPAYGAVGRACRPGSAGRAR
jgi:hypothetical protein